jgi:UDP-glucose 4-epimerase
MTLTWVIGASGLIGQGVRRAALRQGHDVRRVPVPWTRAAADQQAALRNGLEVMREEAAGEPWSVVWVAGAGVIGTSSEALQTESDVFGTFLDDLAATASSARGCAAPGALFLASSAGGLYAGSSAPPFTERSAVVPLSSYGHQKVDMEARATAFAHRTHVPTMIGRMTNVYGPGQNLAKPQGLISQVGKAYLLRRPISLYVPLDTIRDYLYVDDCARMIVAGVDRLRLSAPGDGPVVKILGSGVPMTIATILGEYRRLFRGPPPLVIGDSPNRRYQVKDLRTRSVVWPELNRLARTTVPTGIGATVADLSARLRIGEMAASAA